MLVFQTLAPLAWAEDSAEPVAAAAAAQTASSVTAPELLERAFRNLYGDDYLQTLKISTRSRGSREMKRILQIARKQTVQPGKSLLRFLEPFDIRKTSILMLENEDRDDDLFVFLPALGFTRRLSAAQRGDSFFGTDLWFEDLEPRHIEEHHTEFIGSGTHGDRPCRLLEIRYREGVESSYDRMISCIEIERSVIFWTDLYQRGSAVKRFEVDPDSIQNIDGHFIAFSMTMATPSRNSITTLTTVNYKIFPEIPDALFTTRNLESGDAKRDRVRAAKGK